MVVAFEHANDVADVADPAAASGFGHETTRYLCGAAYTDRVFREAVLGRSREAFRARAPEIGVDVGMVTAHCKRAQNSKMIRDLVICAPSAVFLFLMFKSLDSGALRDGDIGRASAKGLSAMAQNGFAKDPVRIGGAAQIARRLMAEAARGGRIGHVPRVIGVRFESDNHEIPSWSGPEGSTPVLVEKSQTGVRRRRRAYPISLR